MYNIFHKVKKKIYNDYNYDYNYWYEMEKGARLIYTYIIILLI